jgi:transcription-repair coupling factor (superfamily II helicase)
MGVKKIVRDGKEHEVLSVIYAEGVTLHIPVSQTHLLSRYIGVAGKNATLHKLGGKRWKTECVKAERAVVDYASQLLDLQAKRSSIPGTAFDVNPPWMEAFEASFPYKETKDQVSCIEAVKKDMASERPMDRLICGDAGYGKTEIAMRAAFIAVMNGKQVAVLAPTTVLAEQHFTTFKERMGAYPIRIEVVNRLRPPSVREKILSQTAKGSVDILIGTHAIVQPHIGFKELGLVIIDEEQRFGVEHKERLKRVRETVDLLTLSATPIPRTLYMSMTGARDMSLLQTPPQERLEINTKVERDNDTVIRTAVMREINRQGQIFFLHNRVLTINVMYNRLKRLLPEVRIAVAHGQMKPKELSETMKQFESGQYDMLLSTSIIESGLDIPRANTIIIHRADRFGLAELYQLRGRVGRSSRRGYALLLLPEQGIIDGDARERIKAIQRHGGLSGGLNLALRDLEIRGAGNMLGAEQSGHIAAIGFGLYCQLLKRTVARLKGEKPPKMVDVDLLLDFIEIGPNPDSDNDAAAYIPQDYIDEETLRMNIHRRIAEASEISEIRNLGVEPCRERGAGNSCRDEERKVTEREV